LIYTLIEIGDGKGTVPCLAAKQGHVRRAALVALDQMDDGGLNPEQVLPLLNHGDPILKNTAGWIVAHRPEWGAALVEHFRTRLGQPIIPDEEQTQLAAQLAQLAKSNAIQELLSATLRDAKQSTQQTIALRAMAEARLSATPSAWLDALGARLPQFEGDVLAQAVTTARALPLPKGGHAALQAALNEVGRRRGAPLEVRLTALTAAGAVGPVDDALFQELTAHVLPSESLEVRGAAAGILAQAALTSQQRLALLEAVEHIGPLELPKLLPAFEREPSEAFGQKLVAALQNSAGVRGLRPDLVQPLLAKYPPSVQQAGEPLLAQLNVSAAEQAAALDRLIKELPPGNLQRGHEVFVSKKAACSTCHAVGYLGGRLGPDLTGIGKVRTERDLLEAIVFPSASFVRSYEPVLVELEDGRAATGIVVSETAEEIVLATGPEQLLPIARQEIVEVQPTNVSLMPQGFANLLNTQEMADLLAYLKQIQR
jgi:putative heme-binding domain-containing protein